MADDATLKARLRTAYDADAARRAARVPDAWLLEVLDDWVGELNARSLSRVLELGCGTGQMAVHMARAGFAVTAIDLSPANVAAARERGVAATVADFADLPFDDGSYDAAFAFNSMLHVPSDDVVAVLTEIRRVLRRGGLLLVVVWGGREHAGPMDDEWLDPPRYFNLYTDEQLAALAAPGLARVRFGIVPDAAEPSGLHPQVLVLEAV